MQSNSDFLMFSIFARRKFAEGGYRKLNGYLKKLKRNGNINAYKIKNGGCNIDIYLKPALAVDHIKINCVVTPTGADFLAIDPVIKE